jgi:hypothetical protein
MPRVVLKNLTPPELNAKVKAEAEVLLRQVAELEGAELGPDYQVPKQETEGDRFRVAMFLVEMRDHLVLSRSFAHDILAMPDSDDQKWLLDSHRMLKTSQTRWFELGVYFRHVRRKPS